MTAIHHLGMTSESGTAKEGEISLHCTSSESDRQRTLPFTSRMATGTGLFLGQLGFMGASATSRSTATYRRSP
jgi:hypothetical protein